MTANTYGRQVVLPLVNKSGGGVIAGDVVIIDTGNDGAFTTTTTGAYTGIVGIAQETIAANATGRVLMSGYAALVNVNASVTRGHFGATHTVVKQAASAGASRIVGVFCQFLTGGTTPTAHLFAMPDASSAAGDVATDPIWDAAGDLAQGTGANTAAKLTIGAARTILGSTGTTAGWIGYSGAKIYHSTTQNVNNGAEDAILFDSEDWDTDAYHSTGSNTDRLTIPATGRYRVTVNLHWNGGGTNNTGITVTLMKNAGATLVHGGKVIANNENGDGGQVCLTTTLDFTAADYLVVKLYNTTGSTRAIGDASNVSQQSTFEIERVLGV